MPEADEVLPAPLPPYRVLTGLVDRFGRTQTFHREAAGEFSGEITGVTGGWASLPAGTDHAGAAGRRSPAAGLFRRDGTVRFLIPCRVTPNMAGTTASVVSAVWLTHDPEYPDNLPAAPLVRYGWTPRGELAAVYDRSNTQVRSFITMINTGAGWWRTVTRADRKSVTVTTATGG